MTSSTYGIHEFSSEAIYKPGTLVDLLRWRVTQEPHRSAYTFLLDGEEQEQTLSYGELDRQARAIGALLQSRGANGERVLLVCPPGLQYIAAFFGCLYAGAVAVPVYPPRAAGSLGTLQRVIVDSGATAALTTLSVMSRLRPAFNQENGLNDLTWICTDALPQELASQWQAPAIDCNHLAFLQYTSGSTSAPKGVMVSHANLLHNEEMIRKAFRQTDQSIIVGWLPLYHDMGLIGSVLQPLYVGARCIMMSPLAFLQRPLRWLQAVSHHRATTSGGPNFAYELCVSKTTPEQRSSLDLSSWSVAFNGAEPVRPETLDRFARAFESCGFRREAFHPCYGLAEATLLVSCASKSPRPTILTVESKALESNLAIEAVTRIEPSRRVASSGSSPAEQRIVIVDPLSLELCLPTEVGEIWVSGPSVTRGYWNRPEQTLQTFKARLKDGGHEYYLRTGDLGFLNDGELFVTGRLKDLIIIRGLNHYPQDIEHTVERSHPALRPGSGAAFSIQDSGEEKLIIVHAIEQREKADIDAIIGCVRRAVAREHEIEASCVVFVKPGRIPKTSSGKIQRHLCREGFLRGDLEIVGEWSDAQRAEVNSDLAHSYPLGRTEEDIESWLIALLASRLRVDASSIDGSRPVSQYGADSLTSLELAHSIESSLGVEMPVFSFLEDFSIRDLAAQTLARLEITSTASEAVVATGQITPGEHPLSYGQRALWFLQQLSPESTAYNLAFAARIRSELDVPCFRRAFQRLVDRHPALRTTFTAVEGEPRQRIHDHADVYFRQEDASTLSEAALSGLVADRAYTPFDIGKGPLFCVTLFTRSPREHVLLLTTHHIISDLWSLSLVVDEFARAYEAERTGALVSFTPLPCNHIDFASWQSQMCASPEWEGLWEYWREELSGDLPLLNLPPTRPRGPVQSHRGASESFKLNGEAAAKLKELGRAHGATLYVVLMAAFQVLLHRYTGQKDFLVGTPTTGRTRKEWAGVVGYFVNPLVLRADLSNDPEFVRHLDYVKHKAMEGFKHQDYPFALLVERLQPERDLSMSPLFQVAFALQRSHLLDDEGLSSFAVDGGGSRMRLGEIEMEPLALEHRVSQFDLALLMAEIDGGIAGTFQYSADLLDAATIKRMASHFETLVEQIVAHPQRKVSEFMFLSTAEHRELLVDWNCTEEDFPNAGLAHELFQLQAKHTPDALALSFGDELLTFRELNTRANQLARHLRSLGVGPESLVPICMQRSTEMIVAILGVVKAGGAFVPLDSTHPKARLALMLDDIQTPIVLTLQRHIALFPERKHDLLCLDTDWRRIEKYSADDLACNVTGENLAYVIFTSGSTGRPRGVEITHDSLLNLTHWHRREYAVTRADRATQIAGIGFDASVWEIWPYLTAGASVHLPDEGSRNSAVMVRDWLINHRITITFLPTPLAESVMPIEWPEPVVLRAILTGGDRLKRRPPPSVRFEVINHYGPTEYTVVTTAMPVAATSKHETAPSIGRPISNTQVYILDERQGPVAIGVAGELYIAGAGLARCYLNRGDQTAERFIPNPFSREAGRRMYRTGDLGRFSEEGEIEYLGRADQQVKVRGYRIELGEIEAVLCQHPSVEEAAVIVREREGGETRLAGYVVMREGAEASVSELGKYVRGRLPDYMVPVEMRRVERMPLTPNGKTDRKKLEGMKGDDESRDGVEGETARGGVEEVIAGVWMKVLGIERVGREEDFFELGGHSLLATQVVSRIRDAFHVEIPLRSIFEEPTIARLSSFVDGARRQEQGVESTELTRIAREGKLPLSFAQQRLWFLHQLDPDNSFYNISAGVRLRGVLLDRLLERSLNEVVRRHETLRTNLIESDGQPAQVIRPSLILNLPVIDLSELAGLAKAREMNRLIAGEARRPFDLALEPLVRVALFRLDALEQTALVTMHHIISDGWSMGVFIRELAALYKAYSAGEPSALEELPLQYVDYGHWQRETLKGEALERQLSYWKRQLTGASPTLDLPTDRARPPMQNFAGATISTELSEELSRNLNAMSRREGVTLFMLLLASFKTLLYRYTRQADITVGTPIAGRTRAELEGMIGFFANTLALRTNLSGDPTFRELLQQVKETALGAYTHQDLPFEKLVEELQPRRDLSRSPIFQVMFVLQNTPTSGFELPGLRFNFFQADSLTAKFDLLLFVNEGRDGRLNLQVEYSTSLFNESTIRRMLGHIETLTESIVAAPECHISYLPMLSEAERTQILEEWNNRRCEYEKGRCIHDLFQQQAALTPEQIAVSHKGVDVSYRQLNERSNQVAHFLMSVGAGPESIVGICCKRGPDLITGMLGVLKAGAAYLPLDPKYPEARLAYTLDESEAGVVLTHESLRASLPDQKGRVVCLDTDWGQIGAHSTSNPRSGASEQNLAYCIYTSGSTGQPKGVAIEHRSTVEMIEWAKQHYSQEEMGGVLASTSICFDISVFEIFVPLSMGGRVIVVENALEVMEMGRGEGVRLINTVPSAMGEIVRMGGVPEGVETVNLAGEALGRKLVEEVYERGRVKRVVNLYGPTEDTTYSTYWEARRGRGEKVLIGEGLTNTEVYILDERQGPVAIGVTGEVYIAGAGLARCYLKGPDQTAERFIPNPYSSEGGRRMYRTGDLARYSEEGEIDYLGRADQQVKIRGYRIELGEIEAALCEHPSVEEAAVIVREGEGGDRRLAGYVVMREGAEARVSELGKYVRGRLPDYMVPVEMRRLEQMPLTANGKIDRKKLEGMLVGESREEVEREGVERERARGGVEEVIAGVWMKVLGVERVGREEDFFELGGHSLLATQVVSKLREVFQLDLPLRSFFESSTIAAMAQVIERAKQNGGESKASEPVSVLRDKYRVKISSKGVASLPEALKKNPSRDTTS